MKRLVFLFLLCFSFGVLAIPNDFEKLLPILTKENTEKEITPKTTDELKKLFKSDEELPRVFVKKLPADFAQKGDRKLYSKIV